MSAASYSQAEPSFPSLKGSEATPTGIQKGAAPKEGFPLEVGLLSYLLPSTEGNEVTPKPFNSP